MRALLRNHGFRSFLCGALCLAGAAAPAGGAPTVAGFASWSPEALTLDNGQVRRVIALDCARGGISTTALAVPGQRGPLILGGGDEFAFQANGAAVRGNADLEVVRCEPATEARGGSGATVRLRTRRPGTPPLAIAVEWILYPGSPVVRKRLAIENTGKADVSLESLDVERLPLAWKDTDCWTLDDYGRQLHLGPIEGTWHDCAVVVHQFPRREGLVLGNEAPGALKRTTAFLDGTAVTIGLTHADSRTPFRKWLKSGERWSSPWMFVQPYAEVDDPRTERDSALADFVREDLGTSLAQNRQRPVLAYNTWMPFQKDINERLVLDLADAAARCGIEDFVVDSGWNTNCGDWQVDPVKFPHGLEPVFQHVKTLGMKPGLWVSIASVDRSSAVFAQHPEWFAVGPDGKFANLHNARTDRVTACMATGWYDYIKATVLGLIRRYDLAYIKLDLSVATSAYRYDPEHAGCFASGHPGHRDRAESLLAEFQRCQDLFDELHRARPGLFIDCTFETWGALQGIDYALIEHADGDWLSNIEEPMPVGGLRARALAWWRSGAVPAGSLIVGNERLDGPDPEGALLSQAGSFPTLLGDLRKLPPAETARLRRWTDWLRAMEAKHHYALFREDLPGFGGPAAGAWDGWARLNPDTGGIVGVFREGGAEAQRTVTLAGMTPGRTYEIRRAPDGVSCGRLTGRELAERGFPALIPARHGQVLFEVDPQ